MNNKTEENLSCYVVIACEKPSAEGNMKVEMSYEGDPLLVRYLLETGIQTLNEKEEKIN